MSNFGETRKERLENVRKIGLDNVKHFRDFKLLQLLADHGPLTRPELVHVTRIPRSTLFGMLIRLEVLGYVDFFDVKHSVFSDGTKKKRSGHPSRYWKVKEGLVISI